MIQTTVKVSGMACSMCEAHVNDTIRRAFSVEKVSSSHTKGETVILRASRLTKPPCTPPLPPPATRREKSVLLRMKRKGCSHF